MFKKNDILLCAVLLAAAGITWIIFNNVHGGNGAYAVVTVDGNEYARLPLSKDTRLVIETENGKNTLVIEDGKAYMSEADCPDLICVRHKAVYYNGESIVCLPHRVVVKITGGGESPADAVAGR